MSEPIVIELEDGRRLILEEIPPGAPAPLEELVEQLEPGECPRCGRACWVAWARCVCGYLGT